MDDMDDDDEDTDDGGHQVGFGYDSDADRRLGPDPNDMASTSPRPAGGEVLTKDDFEGEHRIMLFWFALRIWSIVGQISMNTLDSLISVLIAFGLVPALMPSGKKDDREVPVMVGRIDTLQLR